MDGVGGVDFEIGGVGADGGIGFDLGDRDAGAVQVGGAGSEEIQTDQVCDLGIGRRVPKAQYGRDKAQ